MMDFQFVEQFGNSPCLIDEKDTISYVDLAEKSNKIVSNLPERSIFALFFLPNIESIAVYLGALRRNHTAILIDPNLDQTLKKKILDKFNIQYIFNGNCWVDYYLLTLSIVKLLFLMLI